MQVIEIDVVGPQALQAFFNGAEYGALRKPALIWPITHFSANLRSHDEFVAFAAQGFAEHAFRKSGLINVGGVDEIDSPVETAVDHFVCGGLIHRLAEG